MILISGLSNKAEAKEFTNKDVADINRVIVEAGNPLTQTLAGRIQIAQDLMQAGLLNKEEYMTVITTGQLEPLYAYEKAELLAIKQTLEALQAGKAVKAMVTDNHPLYIREILTVLASPDARMAPNNPVMTNALAAIQEHLQMWRTMDPALAALQNIPPCPQLQPPPPPPPPERISVSINFPDLPPEAQARLASQLGLVAPGTPVQSPTPPSGPSKTSHKPAPGKENPTGSKRAGAPNIPGVMSPPNGQPGVTPPAMPNLPPGSPAPTQQGFEALQNAIQPNIPK
jgi:DNA-binding transcriptional regulator/RsmH inhibitor MraZ